MKLELTKVILSLSLVLASCSPILPAQADHSEAPIINYQRLEQDLKRDIEQDIAQDLDHDFMRIAQDEEVIACEIEDNTCVPNDGECLGDATRCCSGYCNSRHICEGRE